MCLWENCIPQYPQTRPVAYAMSHYVFTWSWVARNEEFSIGDDQARQVDSIWIKHCLIYSVNPFYVYGAFKVIPLNSIKIRKRTDSPILSGLLFLEPECQSDK